MFSIESDICRLISRVPAESLIVVLILMITTVWNDYLIGITFGGIGAQPMTVILANTVITSFGEVRYNVDMAAALLTAIPTLVVYFALGKFFVQGITADLINALPRFEHLIIVSRAVTSRFEGASADVRQVGTDLAAEYVLTGTLRRGEDRLRISVELADTETAKLV